MSISSSTCQRPVLPGARDASATRSRNSPRGISLNPILVHNGPISLKNFSGDAEITAVNGPISLEGSSGSVRIHTENGPISVTLEGKTWSGTGLTADAKNGPLTLMVPSDYQSSFVVESTNYAPVSCKASICDNARKTWDDNHRRIEYGNAPAMIRLSTVNGPVSVRESREKL